jgi:aminopeptidase N
MLEVQRTGDIFFPRNWVGALLGGHSSVKAFEEVCRFMDDNPRYPTLLMNKIEQAAWGLLTSFKHESGDLDKLKIGERIFFNTKHIKRR